MHSRAYLLLRRDLENLHRFPIEGVSAEPCSELNMMQWQARLEGLTNSPWEGGVFYLRLQFSADFNSSPPAVQFMTVPFHPNIDPSDGTPHCHLLGAGWSEIISIPVLLIALQALLSSPELDTRYTVNRPASEMLQRVPHSYQQMTRDCVAASLRVNAGLAPYEGEEKERVAPPSPAPSLPPLPTPSLKPHSISFDEYFSLWSGIATSIPPGPANNGCAGETVRFRDTRSGRTSLQQKLHQHHLLQHGQGGRVAGQLTTSQTRQQRMERLRLTYAPGEGEGCEEGEREVDQLLKWTKSLDRAILSTPQSFT